MARFFRTEQEHHFHLNVATAVIAAGAPVMVRLWQAPVATLSARFYTRWLYCPSAE